MFICFFNLLFFHVALMFLFVRLGLAFAVRSPTKPAQND